MGATVVPMWHTPPMAGLPDAAALGTPAVSPAPAAPPASSVGAWDDAMRIAGGGDARLVPVQFVPETAPAAPAAPADAIAATPSAPGATAPAVADDGARGRALAGLGLEAPPPAAGPVGEVAAPEGGPQLTAGQTILDGFSRLRGALDDQLASINERIGATRMDASEMMSLQAEVMSYSLMVDVASKLAGKSTQALDTLMKGQ